MMRVRINVKNGKIYQYHGMFIQKERDLIIKAFNEKKKKQQIKDGFQYIEVKELK